MTFRQTPDGLYLVGTAAGPLGGDQLALQIAVDPGATLTVRAAAAALVQPGPRGEPSRTDVEVTVGEGGCLLWAMPPSILLRGCDHTVTITARLSVDARLLWRDQVVWGREGEPGGSLLQRLRVDVGGQPLLRTDLPVGPRWPGSLGPAGTNGAKAVATVLGVGVDLHARPVAGVHLATMRLGDGATLLTGIAQSAGALSRALAPCEDDRKR